MKTITQLSHMLGLLPEELIPYGHYVAKLDYQKILSRLNHYPSGRYVNVTAITPTPLGEGKTTVTIGLVDALARLDKKAIGAIRQPSSGPTFNIKGSGAGGGRAKCMPHDEISLGLTGDIDAVTNAHNLSMVALTSRIHHERQYSDEVLTLKNLSRLNIDPDRIVSKWAIDYCAQALRHIVMTIGSCNEGIQIPSGFQISVSSELMAIVSISRGLKELRERVSRIILAYSTRGQPVTTADLEVDGAITALLVKSLNPNLVQTSEGQPILMHSGPFANIALGQSSILADYLGLKLADYHVTESGFGSDIGYEKFWNVKCRLSGLRPDCVVLVVTMRALKMQGDVKNYRAFCPVTDYTRPDSRLLENGLENLWAHIGIIQRSGITPIVCINHFIRDHSDEIQQLTRILRDKDIQCVVSQHWQQGSEGALALARSVIDACQQPGRFNFLYCDDISIENKISSIATQLYGADRVTYSAQSKEKIEYITKNKPFKKFQICMAKTPHSLSDNPQLKGRPAGWQLMVRDILIFQGAELIVPVTGEINLLPGTGSEPAFRNIDVNVDNGEITGLF